jgi:hypothetical protein
LQLILLALGKSKSTAACVNSMHWHVLTPRLI